MRVHVSAAVASGTKDSTTPPSRNMGNGSHAHSVPALTTWLHHTLVNTKQTTRSTWTAFVRISPVASESLSSTRLVA
jgi:hypothetical protein